MDTNTYRPRVFQVQDRMIEIHEIRDRLAKHLMHSLGNGSVPGINIDNLTKFARDIIELNREFEELSAEHSKLMGK